MMQGKPSDLVVEDDKRASQYRITHRRTNASILTTSLPTATFHRYFIERTGVADPSKSLVDLFCLLFPALLLSDPQQGTPRFCLLF
jgi:hypothetical protein